MEFNSKMNYCLICDFILFIIGATATQNSQGAGPIFLDEVRCNGLEYRVFDCLHAGIEVTGSCTHLNDAGVICVAGINE